MRTSKTVSISMAPTQFKEVEKLAKKENRTLSELVREALRQYQQSREQASVVNGELIAALRCLQEDAQRTGLDNTSMRAINTEVAAARRNKRAKQGLKQPAT